MKKIISRMEKLTTKQNMYRITVIFKEIRTDSVPTTTQFLRSPYKKGSSKGKNY